MEVKKGRGDTVLSSERRLRRRWFVKENGKKVEGERAREEKKGGRRMGKKKRKKKRKKKKGQKNSRAPSIQRAD